LRPIGRIYDTLRQSPQPCHQRRPARHNPPPLRRRLRRRRFRRRQRRLLRRRLRRLRLRLCRAPVCCMIMRRARVCAILSRRAPAYKGAHGTPNIQDTVHEDVSCKVTATVQLTQLKSCFYPAGKLWSIRLLVEGKPHESL
jgi:hypothetical protein